MQKFDKITHLSLLLKFILSENLSMRIRCFKYGKYGKGGRYAIHFALLFY